MIHPGLFKAGGEEPVKCALHRVKVVADIAEYLSEVQIEQQYQHLGKTSAEVVYIFPLPHKAVVTGFVAKVGDAEIRGEIQERKAARQAYEEAMREGDSPFLMESHRHNVFQVSLGRIRPQEKVSISISYIEVPAESDDELRFLLPTVVAPRYVPGTRQGEKRGPGVAHPTDRVPDADFVTPPVGDSPYTLEFVANISLTRGIASIASPSHRIAVDIHDSKNTARVTLATESEQLNRDLVLVCKSRQEAQSVAVAGEPPYADFAHVRLVPLHNPPEIHASHADSPREYIFLLDVSGSMDGEKLKQAKKALRICLRNLEFGDLFNVVAFESRFKLYSPRSVEYTQQQLDSADRWIDKLQSAGGTEIYEPLAHVLQSAPPRQGYERVVLLFTDGQVSNEAEVIELVRSHSQGLSLFTFGIDTAVNTAFIDGVASAGNGLPEYIYPGERVEEKVIRQFSRLKEPHLGNATLEVASGAILATAPAVPARLYSGDAYTFVCHTPGLAGEQSLTLRGSCMGTPHVCTIPLSPGANGRLLALRWAQERIRTIEQLMEVRNERKAGTLRQEAVELSMKHGILSSFTSFLAIHRRADKDKGEVTTTVVPVALPEAWTDVFSVHAMQSPPFFSFASAVVSENMFFREAKFSLKRSLKKDYCDHALPSAILSTNTPARFDSAFHHSHSEEDAEQAESPVISLVYQVTAQQNADGSYGRGAEQVPQTARFIVGLLHAEVDWTPYRNQLKKAGTFLMDKAHGNSLALLALRLLVLRNVLNTESIRQTIAKMIDELSTEQAALLKTADEATIAAVLTSLGIRVNGVELLSELCED